MYTSWYEAISELTTEDKALLLDAIFQYHLTGDMPGRDDHVRSIFMILKSQFDYNEELYNKICERNKTNGMKGGRPPKKPKKPTGLSGNPNDMILDDDEIKKEVNPKNPEGFKMPC